MNTVTYDLPPVTFCVFSVAGINENTNIAVLFGDRVESIDLATACTSLRTLLKKKLAGNRRGLQFEPAPIDSQVVPRAVRVDVPVVITTVFDIERLQQPGDKSLARAAWAAWVAVKKAAKTSRYMLGRPRLFCRSDKYWDQHVAFEELLQALCGQLLPELSDLDLADVMRLHSYTQNYRGPAIAELLRLTDKVRERVAKRETHLRSIRVEAEHLVATEIAPVVFEGLVRAEEEARANRNRVWNTLAEICELIFRRRFSKAVPKALRFVGSMEHREGPQLGSHMTAAFVLRARQFLAQARTKI